MRRFISLHQTPTVSINPVVQIITFIFLWFEENSNSNNNNKIKVTKFKLPHCIFSECLKFCFMGIIQQELDQVKQVHNMYRIRPYPNQECPGGWPNFIYNVPEKLGIPKILQKQHYTLTLLFYVFRFFLSLFISSGTTNEAVPVTEMDLNNVLSSDYYTNKSNFWCVPEFEELHHVWC